MWQADRINRIMLVFFFAGLLSFGSYAQDQTIKINIQLPAGVGLSAKSGGGSAGTTGSSTSNASDNGMHLLRRLVGLEGQLKTCNFLGYSCRVCFR